MSKKKKIILGAAATLVGLLVIAVVVLAAKLDDIVKQGAETVGPRLTQTSIQLEKVAIGLLSGSGEVDGLVVGSPAGYKAEYTMKVAHSHLAIQPTSLLSDKIVVDKILIEGPEIILEGGLKENNLTAIQRNVTAAVGTGSASAPAPDEPAGVSKKLQVNHFRLSGAKVHLRLSGLAGKNVTITAPDIELKNLGTGPDGITSGELVKLAMDAITADIVTAAAKSMGELGKEAANAAGQAATEAVGAVSTEAAGKATEGLKSLFNKKQ